MSRRRSSRPSPARNCDIKLLEERGWSRERAYVVVDVPNVTVSALLPEDIFADER
jgi:hypothetical protein